MIEKLQDDATDVGTISSRDWVRKLAKYRNPNHLRSVLELLFSAVPFTALWAVAWWALSVSYWLALVIAIVNGAFVVRLFGIQHDCGHSAFFRNRHAGDWLGRVLGVVTLTPYDLWRRTHSIHHSSSGNLDRRGLGDVLMLTVSEYRQLSPLRRFMYQLYRHPLILFGLGPLYIFFWSNRVPYGQMAREWKYWTSAMSTNLGIALALGIIVYFGGWMPLLLIFLPTSIVGASIGVWMFYVQHQFEYTHWENDKDWDLHEAALQGSTHYVLPVVLQWLTANIGIHHVHHLYSRIPFYRLTEVLRDYPVLANAQRLTLKDSLACARLQLWDERARKLLTYKQARAAYGPI